ncbi:hypothetical protein [Microbacterium suaedae]|uniref:hypothetical protein n=1 Tax=Microbacterium suaedae TaxID=2067813 RepID=UPI0013A67BEC|nr:hypothetical protein [Microbacterium suaedae]
MPTQVAVNWGADGPDGFGPAWILPALTGGLVAGFTALISVPITVSFARSAEGVPPTNLRFIVAILWATIGFFATCLTAALYLQRGLEPGDPIVGMGAWAGVGAGVAALLAVAGVVVAPRPDANSVSASPTEDATARLEVASGERLVWSRTVPLKTEARLVLWFIATASLACGAYLVATRPSSWWTWILATVAVLAVLTAFTLRRIRVTASARGVRVRTGLGTTLCRIDADRITAISTGTPPTGAGRGFRLLNDGSRAILMNSGPVLRVQTQKPDADLIVSLPNADDAAAVLRASVPKLPTT